MAIDRRDVIDALSLEPLPQEGGMFRRTVDEPASTAIYFLVEADHPTRLHRLPGLELFHFYLGDPARLLILGPDGRVEEPTLGPDLAAGERPQAPVPGGCWQAVESLGAWSLLGTTMAPRFAWEDFEPADRARMLEGWPAAAERIARHA